METAQIVDDIKEYSQYFTNIKFGFVKRSANAAGFVKRSANIRGCARWGGLINLHLRLSLY